MAELRNAGAVLSLEERAALGVDAKTAASSEAVGAALGAVAAMCHGMRGDNGVCGIGIDRVSEGRQATTVRFACQDSDCPPRRRGCGPAMLAAAYVVGAAKKTRR